MESIDEILRKLKAGEEVDICDIYASVSLSGKQGDEKRLAALIAYASSNLVEPLAIPAVATYLNVNNDYAYYGFTEGCRRASLVATGGDIRFLIYNLNDGVPTGTEFGHIILQNERIDIRLPENAGIHIFSGGAATLYISELI